MIPLLIMRDKSRCPVCSNHPVLFDFPPGEKMFWNCSVCNGTFDYGSHGGVLWCGLGDERISDFLSSGFTDYRSHMPRKKRIEQYEHKGKTRVNNPQVGLVDAAGDPPEQKKSYA